MSDKLSPNNNGSPSVDFATVDGAGNQIATEQQKNQVLGELNSTTLDELNQFATITFRHVGKWADLSGRIMGRVVSSTSEFSDSTRPQLLRAEPADLKRFPILAEFTNGHLELISRDEVELERAVFGFTVFQRLRDSIGGSLEQRLDLGSGKMPLENFVELFELERPHAVAEAELERLAAIEKEKRCRFEKAVAALPPKVSNETKLGDAIAEGVVRALAALGIKQPQPAK